MHVSLDSGMANLDLDKKHIFLLHSLGLTCKQFSWGALMFRPSGLDASQDLQTMALNITSRCEGTSSLCTCMLSCVIHCKSCGTRCWRFGLEMEDLRKKILKNSPQGALATQQ